MNSKSQTTIYGASSECISSIEAGVNMANALKCYSYLNKKPITGISLELNQIPSEQNNNTAVVTSTVTTACGSFQGIGSATGLMVDGEPDAQRTIDGACMLSLVRAFGTASLVETGKAFLPSSQQGKVIVIDRSGCFGNTDEPMSKME